MELKSRKYLQRQFFLVSLLVLVLAGCQSGQPTPTPTALPFKADITEPKQSAIELAVGDSMPLSASVAGGQAARYEWTPSCLKATEADCRKTLKSLEGDQNYATAPQLPGEQISIKVVAYDEQGRPSEPGYKTIKIISGAVAVAPIATTPGDAVAQTPPSVDIAPVKTSFTFPTKGEMVPYKNSCQGTITNMPPDRQLWVVVYPHENLKYHPQNGPAAVGNLGDWRNACYIGGQTGSAGEKFDILAVLVNAQGGQAFKDYLKNAPTMNPPYDGMEALPDGAVIVGEVKDIVRQ